MYKKNRLIAIGVATVVAHIVVFSCPMYASATAYYRSIDNDTNVSGYGNSSYSSYVYMQASGLFNGDARYTSSSNSNNWYRWSFPYISIPGNYCNYQIGAYLNHSSFTDIVSYGAEYYPDVYYFTGYIDQDNAASGWNFTATKNVKSYVYTIGGGFYTGSIEIMPSGASGKRTGADEVSVYIS
jgi:hypothetical protein